MTISKHLYEALTAWREEARKADEGREHKSAVRRFGLCSWVEGFACEEVAVDYELSALLDDHSFPFSVDADGYSAEVGQMHRNPRRRAFVDYHIAEYEAAHPS